MFTFTLNLPLFSIFLLFSTITTTTTGQPYIASENFVLNCGSSTPITTDDGRTWDGDEKSQFIRSNILTTSFSSQPSIQDPSTNHKVYTSARIFNTSSFTYKFPVSQGPKFLRLYFYPATYSYLNSDQSFFSATSNGFSLLTNFSASLTASFLARPSFVKEFIINVKDTQILDLTFTPSPNSFAFIIGIEVVSMPENLYFKPNNFKSVGGYSEPGIDNNIALENLYRLNVGGGYISGEKDTGMHRSWDADNNYIFPQNATGVTPLINSPITYNADTPNYTAPELVYQTQRTRGNLSAYNYTMTWKLPVDSGFWYMVRLHFCSIIDAYTNRGIVFQILINNQFAEEEADLFVWTPGIWYAVFKDYVVFVDGPDQIKQDLLLQMHPNERASHRFIDFFLNGLEVFKLNMTGNLSSPNPESGLTPPLPSLTSPRNENKKRTKMYAAIYGGGGGGLVLFSALGFIIFRHRLVNHKSSGEPKSKNSGLPTKGRCHRFSLKEVKEATNKFNEDFVIGKGGFGKVYKGYIENARVVVAIKRLNSSSKQGYHEFQTKIGLLSKLRHDNLVSLVGFCDDEGEMLLVYDYMAQGTLREHLYNTNNPRLSWKARLIICIGAAKGLHYHHTGANRVIIHRDVKSTNILLDENSVAKVSDFGLSKLGPKNKRENHVSTIVKGTFGYMDPEYYRIQQLTNKSDVYSFGVVLLEVLCARLVIDIDLPYEEVNLGRWAKSHYRKGTLHEIIDPKLSGEITPKCLMKVAEVANDSLNETRSKRPSIDEVVWGLEFALQLQEVAEKIGGIVGEFVFEKQELLFSIQRESTSTYVMQHGMLPNNSHGGIDSETILPR